MGREAFMDIPQFFHAAAIKKSDFGSYGHFAALTNEELQRAQELMDITQRTPIARSFPKSKSPSTQPAYNCTRTTAKSRLEQVSSH
jgi:hypothetical protein